MAPTEDVEYRQVVAKIDVPTHKKLRLAAIEHDTKMSSLIEAYIVSGLKNGIAPQRKSKPVTASKTKQIKTEEEEEEEE